MKIKYFPQREYRNIPVMGHSKRLEALESWNPNTNYRAELIGHKHKPSHCDLLIVDCVVGNQNNPYIERHMNLADVCVLVGNQMVDSRSMGYDLVINQDYMTHKFNAGRALGGYLIFNFLFAEMAYKMRHQEKRGTIVMPGSNTDGFFEIYKHEEGHEIVSGLTQKTIARKMALAENIICPASITALEAIAMGCNAYLVKTSDDQVDNYNNLTQTGKAGIYVDGEMYGTGYYLDYEPEPIGLDDGNYIWKKINELFNY